MDPLTLVLFVVGGLWLLALSLVLAAIRSEQTGLQATLTQLQTAQHDLKLELITAVRTEIALAFALHGPTAGVTLSGPIQTVEAVGGQTATTQRG